MNGPSKTSVVHSNHPKQSSGAPPTPPPSSSSKRNSGIFSFFKWFRSSSRESVSSASGSANGGSVESLSSTGTAASFSYVPPAAYAANVQRDKRIQQGPETDTYRARLKQRDRVREKDKNTTLRQKYNLFFSRDKDTATKRGKCVEFDDYKSLPLMTKHKMADEEEKGHRRTNSDSARAYLHVKGKRKAPVPPAKESSDNSSLRRKKRLAPQPPPPVPVDTETIEYVDVDVLETSGTPPDVVQNDSLRLDHGVLQPMKNLPKLNASPKATPKLHDFPVSPKPWYKRGVNVKRENKYEPVMLPVDNNNDKRKSNMMFLTNISELDREANEIMRKTRPATGEVKEMPEFMKLKTTTTMEEGPDMAAAVPSKRKSAKDLIAKFNAITSVTKVTVNTALFGGGGNKRDYFGREQKEGKSVLQKDGHGPAPLMKSGTSACILTPTETTTPKMDRRSWTCPKCSVDNDYWRIICSKCSTIKPYFDDTSKLKESETKIKAKEGLTSSTEKEVNSGTTQTDLPQLSRSRTQIHFYNHPQTPKTTNQLQLQETKLEEKEKLKKMLIEMKNSLPKRKRSGPAMQKRKSTIDETPEHQMNEDGSKPKHEQAETTKPEPEETQKTVIYQKKDEIYQLMRAKDFEDIYAEKVANPESHLHVYENDEKRNLNVPKGIQDLKQQLRSGKTSDTLEINKLLKRLETAISKGDLQDASGYARELAQLKVNCSVVRQRSEEQSKGKSLIVQMYVEDRLSHRGPFPIQVQLEQTVRELKQQIEKTFEIPTEVQRWIIGKQLATNENATLREHNMPEKDPSLFLYLVTPTNHVEKEVSIVDSKHKKSEVLGTESSNTSTSGVVLTKASALPRSENSAFVVVNPQGGVGSRKTISPPKIVGGQLKVHVMIKPRSDSDTQIVNEDIPQRTDLVTAVKTSIVVQQAPSRNEDIPQRTDLVTAVKTSIVGHQAPRAEEEDVTIYDTKRAQKQSKTGKSTEATKNWVCRMCTLVNISTANACSICATVRLNTNEEELNTGKEPNHLHYYELMNLDHSDLVANAQAFECLICFAEIEPELGVTLRECLHQFCRGCLAQLIEFSEDAEIRCPYRDKEYSCDIALQDREIKALVAKPVYEQYLARSVAHAENTIDKSFHCKTPDCTGWCIYEDNVNEFPCPLCKRTNCLTCQAIHSGMNCWQYQETLNESDDEAKQTRAWFNELLDKGEALMCPACRVILMKKWGCDWVRCSMCKTEICWVTRGLRWGPGGKGDVSGGCKCGINGVKCHAKCNYCH